LPGKADCIKDKDTKTQKRVLNDYMYNLHLKFTSESQIKISKASFYRARPKYISLVNFASRSVCLCSKHQNFSFLLRSMKSLGITSCTNPDKFVDMYKDSTAHLDELLNKMQEGDGDDIKFQQWKRVKEWKGEAKSCRGDKTTRRVYLHDEN